MTKALPRRRRREPSCGSPVVHRRGHLPDRSPALRLRGIDAVSTPEADRLGESDESQLTFAAAEGRALISFNTRDFASLHANWLREGRSHAGMIVSQQRPIGDVVRRLLMIAAAMNTDEMRDRLEFLGDWPANG